MKRALIGLVVAATGLLACTSSASAQGTTYTQTTQSCTLTQCLNANLVATDGTTATMTYGAFFDRCGDQNKLLEVNWNGTEYNDGKASTVFVGSVYKGHNYYPWSVWELSGTFNNGTMTLIEHVVTYRGCAGGKNLDGSVTVQ